MDISGKSLSVPLVSEALKYLLSNFLEEKFANFYSEYLTS